jgi:hypothetical protein
MILQILPDFPSHSSNQNRCYAEGFERDLFDDLMQVSFSEMQQGSSDDLSQVSFLKMPLLSNDEAKHSAMVLVHVLVSHSGNLPAAACCDLDNTRPN